MLIDKDEKKNKKPHKIQKENLLLYIIRKQFYIKTKGSKTRQNKKKIRNIFKFFHVTHQHCK
jgi:hypothetical protein